VDAGDHEPGVPGDGLGHPRLRLALEGVVDLFGDPGGQFAGQRHHVQAAGEGGDRRRQALDLAQIALQGGVGTRVLHLDRHRLPGSRQGRAVDLTDGRRCGRPQFDAGEVRAPLRPEFGAQHRLEPGGRHRWRPVLQAGQLLPVGGGQILRQHRLEHAQRLAELHRPALELAEDGEQLVCGGLAQRGVHILRGGAENPPAQTHRGPASRTEGQAEQSRAATQGTLRHHLPQVVGGFLPDLAHAPSVPTRESRASVAQATASRQPHAGCPGHERDRIR